MNELRNYGIEIKTIMAVYLCSLNKVYEQMSNEIQKRSYVILLSVVLFFSL